MERDLRLRTHAGALTHFYLDALLGLVAIHTHGGQPAVRREHESLLTEWARAGLNLQRAVLSLETLQFLVGFGLAIWLLASHLGRAAAMRARCCSWSIGRSICRRSARKSRSLPGSILRIATSRCDCSSLSARWNSARPARADQPRPGAAVSIAFENVSVVAAGHQVLRDINLSIAAGTHVAIVGASGAGKSSLVGLLLGWHRAASGSVFVDGVELDDSRLDQLRPHIAWVDPAVQLWNRPLLENLRYGLPAEPACRSRTRSMRRICARVIERLPHGLETPLGEAGGLVSGGEGQRVRLGRALLRPGVRLAILDEPFRGLDFEQRHKLLARSREIWRDATLLAISHDIAEAMTFERVLVLEDGRIVEDGNPRELARNPESRFHAMLEAERAIREEFWNGAEWRHLRLNNGQLT